MRVRTIGALLLCLCVAAAAAAQSKGNGRINGKILDDQGKPAANVQVRATHAGDSLILEAKSNDKGEWSMQNMAAGQWNFEFIKEGFDPQRVQVQIADNRNPPIEIKLTKAVDPNVELQAEMKKAAALQQEGKTADARKIIEDLLAKYPTVYRLHAFLATSYEAEKNYDKAIEHMKIVTEKEPADLDLKMYLAELLTAKGDRAEAQKILDSVDMTQVKDATVFINIAIGSINAGKGDEAVALLDKVSKQFPTRADIFYYRGRANITSKKMVEAKADLEKFVAMAAPDARELADAKKLLEQLKDVK
ncbi:MAG TPA: tetratricopeptide repeat protein [Vicinamibacterales bacterium]|nr:tetratricopeptide repeat protein [Vicinamibacterales bacterium]